MNFCCPEISCGIDILILDIFFLKYLSLSFDLLIGIGRRAGRFLELLSFAVDLGEIEFSIRVKFKFLSFLVVLDLFSSLSFLFLHSSRLWT